jgi:pimeloyl-ACP methyl ester carboxylesterase
MAPVLEVASRQAKALRRLRFLPVFDLGERWIQKKTTDIENDEIRATAPILPRFPLSRMFDLFELQDLARDAEPRITCPTLIIGAVNDHVVETSAVMALADRLPFSKKVLLQRGFHIIPRDNDRALALTEISHFLDTVAR